MLSFQAPKVQKAVLTTEGAIMAAGNPTDSQTPVSPVKFLAPRAFVNPGTLSGSFTTQA
jgi:hypothetical protein